MRFGDSKGMPASAEAIEAVYRLRFRAFLKVAAGVAGERNAADAVHNGFVRALRHRRSFRGDASLETWLWRTVINAARDLRDRDRDVLRERPELADSGANGHAPDLDDQLRAVVLGLPNQQRLALFLRYYADLDYRAIADVLGISPGTVAATLHKAHAAVRRQLEEVTRCTT